MKRFKKVSILLLVCLMLSVMVMPVSVSAAKLNKKSVSLNVGKTYTLKVSGIKGKITWTSSQKSVATVSSKGKVKAKKRGAATIYVTLMTKPESYEYKGISEEGTIIVEKIKEAKKSYKVVIKVK